MASIAATWRVLRPVRRFGHPQFHGRCLSGGKRCARCALSLLRSTAWEGQISAVQSTIPVALLLMTELNTSPPVRLPKPHRALGVVILLALFLLAGVLTFKISEKQGFNHLRDEASHQLDVLAAAIDSEVTRHASIPVPSS